MKQKKLMLLGGIRYVLPVIEVAHQFGCHVITVDYIPDNIAHTFSDEYHNLSIMDKDAVLKLAKDLQIDGILSYAVDPGVVTAAYVAEQLGLPFTCSYESACILQDKSLFRHFLAVNGFNVPKAKGYTNAEDAIRDIDYFDWPVIVKPVDSAGSKGVRKVTRPEDLGRAISYALEESHNGHFIIEDFLEKDGFSSGSESFFIDGVLRYNAFYDQFFDNNAANPFTPSAEIWPTEKNRFILDEIKSELQRLGDLLKFRTGLLNVEWRVCKDGKVYLMEVSPRAGGNRLAELLNYATDVNIIEAEVSKAICKPLLPIHEPIIKDNYCILVLHSEKAGKFVDVTIGDNFSGEIIEKEIRVKKGDNIEAFSGANNAIGTLFLKFDSREEAIFALTNHQEWLSIIVE